MPNRYCILVPHYHHERQFQQILAALVASGLPTIIVDDGSTEASRRALEVMIAGEASITLLRLAENRGKGAAVLFGLRGASERGYTHAVQLDADGQHRPEDIPAMVEMADRHPQAIVSGLALLGGDAPKSRVYGRKFTLMWVRIESLGCEIRDAMCGFRIYPVEPVLRLAESRIRRLRMEFDIEVLVRYVWSGGRVRHVPCRVHYLPAGVSHFRMWRDNCLITKMHLLLLAEMLLHAPRLLARRMRRAGAAGS